MQKSRQKMIAIVVNREAVAAKSFSFFNHKSKAMKVRSVTMKDLGGCCGTGNECCGMNDWGCC